MTGWVLAYGACFGCGRTFAFNPVTVPSIRVDGTREPICEGCIARANEARRAKGRDPIAVAPDAYGPAPESEVL